MITSLIIWLFTLPKKIFITLKNAFETLFLPKSKKKKRTRR